MPKKTSIEKDSKTSIEKDSKVTSFKMRTK